MFRKQDDSLWRLNQELLAEEDDAQYEEMLDEWDDCEEEEISGEAFDDVEEDGTFLYRNHANGYGAEVRNYANRYGRGQPKQFAYLEDEDDLEDEEYLARRDYRKADSKNKKKNLGWVIIAFLEVLAIAAIAVWWLSWML